MLCSRYSARASGRRLLLSLAGCAGMSQQACLSQRLAYGRLRGRLARPIRSGRSANYRKQCAEHGVQPTSTRIAKVTRGCRLIAGRQRLRGRPQRRVLSRCLPANLEPGSSRIQLGSHLYDLESAVRTSTRRSRATIRAGGIRGSSPDRAAMISSDTTTEDRRPDGVSLRGARPRYGELTRDAVAGRERVVKAGAARVSADDVRAPLVAAHVLLHA